jgi:hypothetical protein
MRKLLATAAVFAALAGSAAASPGAPHVTVLATDVLPAGEQVVEDFDAPTAAGFTFTQGSPGAFVRSGSLGLASGLSAPPPGDLTNYETITGGATATLTSSRLLSEVSFYLGSPDSYNWVRFNGPGYSWTLSGSNLFTPPTAFGGDQSVGRRIVYKFDGAVVNSVTFGSSGNSFEFDRIAAAGGVPEPQTWALTIVGFAALGAALRRRRTVQLSAA